MAPKKGSKIFHNPETRETKLFTEEKPGPPWIQGRAPWDRKKQSPEWVSKRAESMKRRVREKGPTEAELKGYEKLSKTRREGDFSPSLEVCAQIAETLRGRKQVWVENKSRASCRRGNCDTIYVLKITTEDGLVFGKWGSTKESTFQFREKEFRRKKFDFQLLFWQFFGETTEDAEAFLGRKLSQHPAEVPHFFGHTENFEWSEKTQQILKETINALEESAPPKGDW
jgi:hypothetical protein